ncbi:hypothetical protein ABZ642_40365 [Streptomyces sp. NPDC007157]|uniref:hypothetical protein n=1 Tax=Streptomyces sp. NPDC007157 TaxID=3154681 RepID=UPI0033F09938
MGVDLDVADDVEVDGVVCVAGVEDFVAALPICDALKAASLPCSDGTCREARKRVEAKEPLLKVLPAA